MQSKNVSIEKINKGKQEFDKLDKETTANNIRDKIITTIEMTKRSGVPALFFSNPGYGKTTTIKSYAKLAGMHVEELIGSQYSQDEILGFQSRTDKTYLEVLEPMWYHRIITFSKPHFERISSDNQYELVEESDVEEWTNQVESLKNKIVDLEGKVESADNILKRSYNLEIEKMKSALSDTEKNLNDIHICPPRASILFLDELSTASPTVQGAILNLCFERKIRGDKKLPDDCIILSAANYKANLPTFTDIIAPELNRFCIVNLLPTVKDMEDSTKSTWEKLGTSLVDEFLQGFKEVDIDIPKFRNDFTMNKHTQEMFLKDYRLGIKSIIRKYTGIRTSKAFLNFRNINFDGVYGRDDDIPEVYGFITPRTLSYFARVLKALCEMGVKPENNIYEAYADGLLGLGTNNWSTDNSEAFQAAIEDFQKSIYDLSKTLLLKYTKNYDENSVSGTSRKIESNTGFLSNENTITGKINSLLRDEEHGVLQLTNDKFASIIKQINEELSIPSSPESFKESLKKRLMDSTKVIQYRSDLESLKVLYELLSRYKDQPGVTELMDILKDSIIDSNDFYYYAYVN